MNLSTKHPSVKNQGDWKSLNFRRCNLIFPTQGGGSSCHPAGGQDVLTGPIYYYDAVGPLDQPPCL